LATDTKKENDQPYNTKFQTSGLKGLDIEKDPPTGLLFGFKKDSSKEVMNKKNGKRIYGDDSERDMKKKKISLSKEVSIPETYLLT